MLVQAERNIKIDNNNQLIYGRKSNINIKIIIFANHLNSKKKTNRKIIIAIQKKSIIFASPLNMKYHELERKLRKAGCYQLVGKQVNGHPAWYSPITGKIFGTSNHGTLEVKPGTLRQILKDAGLN